MTNFTFHVVSLPHTQVTAEYSSCAFTQKVRRFVDMMVRRGHEVYLYAGVEAQVSQRVDLSTCISEQERAEIVGDGHYTAAPWDHPLAVRFYDRVIDKMRNHIKPKDFICLIGGWAQKGVADAFPEHIAVEFGIGYPGTFASFRVFESYAWMHMVYGGEEPGGPGAKDGHWYDAVIPNQFFREIENTTPARASEVEDYFLYVGRLIDRKGYRLAQELCEAAGVKLRLIGPGDAAAKTGYGRFIGEANGHNLISQMRWAKALMVPTQYVEPFGTVHIEAMGLGTPVITTDWGVFTETVEQGVDGFRCRTFAEFLRAMERVDYLDRDKIKQRAVDRFSMSVVAEQYERYFQRLYTLWGAGFYER